MIEGADIFLGLSAAGALKPEMLKKMAPNPLILALANPNAGDHAGGGQGARGPTPWSARAGRTIPTRSTTSSASPSSSAARWMWRDDDQ